MAGIPALISVSLILLLTGAAGPDPDRWLRSRSFFSATGKREEIHTRCNTCEAHTDQIIYQNEEDGKYSYLCSCWTDTNMDRDPRAVIQLRT